MQELEVAKQAAIAAGKKILEFYKQDMQITEKVEGSYVSHLTEADTAANKIITEALKANFSHPILSEEDKNDRNRLMKGVVWIVDPLDGTKEFINQRDEFTVNIALVYQGEPHIGVIYVPVTGDLYYAVKNQGAYLNEQKISVSERKEIPEMTLVVSRSHAAKGISDVSQKIGFKDMKISGSSLKGCLVAKGSADCYIRLGPVNEWDICAMDIIVKEAGGKMTDVLGRNLTYNKADTLVDTGFVVSNAYAHPEILASIKKYK